MSTKYFPTYFMKKGSDFDQFWKKYLSQDDKKILFILGLGFDPRALNCLKIIQKNNTNSTINFQVMQYDTSLSHKSYMRELLNRNKKELESMIPKEKWNTKTVRMMSGQEYAMSVDAVKSISKSDLENYTDIVIDISAMPNGVYFPITRKILDWINHKEIQQSNGKKINFHIVVSENAEFDGMIKEIDSSEKVTFMHKFGAVLQLESIKNLPKIWIPLLGERQKTQLEKINAEISPKETSPIFPMPSVDPYRSKNLLLNYREFLFDTLDINPRNFIFSSEQNPFETCRKIYETAHFSYDSFRALGGCHVVLSALSSKLLSVGCLLAAYELRNEGSNVGIAHVENQTYDIDNIKEIDKIKDKSIPCTLWLTGECYNE